MMKIIKKIKNFFLSLRRVKQEVVLSGDMGEEILALLGKYSQEPDVLLKRLVEYYGGTSVTSLIRDFPYALIALPDEHRVRFFSFVQNRIYNCMGAIEYPVDFSGELMKGIIVTPFPVLHGEIWSVLIRRDGQRGKNLKVFMTYDWNEDVFVMSFMCLVENRILYEIPVSLIDKDSLEAAVSEVFEDYFNEKKEMSYH